LCCVVLPEKRDFQCNFIFFMKLVLHLMCLLEVLSLYYIILFFFAAAICPLSNSLTATMLESLMSYMKSLAKEPTGFKSDVGSLFDKSIFSIYNIHVTFCINRSQAKHIIQIEREREKKTLILKINKSSH
jgi:hypothetical protein